MKRQKQQRVSWRRLDNTAKLFPVISNENLTNVFRVSATLNTPVKPDYLKKALDEILPWFEGFQVKLRRGIFWYYFETNKKTPHIEKESTYPCKYLDPHGTEQFLFRVTYYDRRINLEVFHAITDGMGAVNFLKELTYAYLKLLRGDKEILPSQDCILGVEDSYVKNYKKRTSKMYPSIKAYRLKGDTLYLDAISVIHGYVDTMSLKAKCREKNVSITKYTVAVLLYCIYKEYTNGQGDTHPVVVNLPINLRTFFNSTTTANFFAITAISFLFSREGHTFDEVLAFVSRQMDENITKEKMEETISYNVSNEKKWILRIAPLPFKYLAMKAVYRRSSKSSTTTLSNLGLVKVPEEFENEIEQFHFVIGVSKKQNMKCGMASYKDKTVITFTSVLRDTYLQRAFFRYLSQEGMDVIIESNGVGNERF